MEAENNIVQTTEEDWKEMLSNGILQQMKEEIQNLKQKTQKQEEIIKEIMDIPEINSKLSNLDILISREKETKLNKKRKSNQ